MLRQRRLLSDVLLVALLLNIPALRTAAEQESDRFAPVETPMFVDSGQELGGAASRDVALGDLDGDGDLDALVANTNAPLALWLNNGGLFTAGTQALGGFGSNAVALADLDGDGDLDAVAVLNTPGDALRILVNQGPPSPGVFLPSGQTVAGVFSEVAVGDVDGDGDPDLFLTGPGLGNQVWLNSGSMPVQFSDSDQRLGNDASEGAALGDVDGDGDLDAVVANALGVADSANVVWINQGGAQRGVQGFFVAGARLGSTSTAAVALGDVDGDSRPDIVAVNLGTDRLWRNLGFGLFSDSGQSLDGGLGTDGALADLDGDGDLDLFVTNISGGNSVWLNEGSGAFVDSGQRLGSDASRGVALGDLDGNGSLDAFVANDGANRVWHNQASIPTGGADVSVMLPPTRYIEGFGTSCAEVVTASFDVTVHNAGPQTATNVTVHTASGSFSWPLAAPTHNFGTLFPGESATVSLAGVPGRDASTGTIYCVGAASVWVTADQADAETGNNTSQSEAVAYSCHELCALEAIFCHYSPPTLRPLSPLQSLQEAVIDLLVYYYVRDGVLAGTPAGRHYIDLYEAHEAEIRGLLDANPSLQTEAVTTLRLWEPNLWAMLRGRGETMTITAGQVAAVEAFLDHLSDVASAGLQQTIAAERIRLPLDHLVGMSMDEARGVIVGHGLYLPVVARR